MLLPPPWSRYLLAVPINIPPRPALHSFSSTPCVLHVHSISYSLLIITVIFVITPTCEALHYATLAILSYALITPFSKKPMFFPLVVPRLRLSAEQIHYRSSAEHIHYRPSDEHIHYRPSAEHINYRPSSEHTHVVTICWIHKLQIVCWTHTLQAVWLTHTLKIICWTQTTDHLLNTWTTDHLLNTYT
jgi:hypothetical protein